MGFDYLQDTYSAVAIIIAAVIILVQNHKQAKASKETQVTTEEVKTTLTSNNGGSSVKDRLDSLERGQDEIIKSLTFMEGFIMGRKKSEDDQETKMGSN